MDTISIPPISPEQNQTPTLPPSVELTPRKTFTPKFIWTVVGLLILGGVASAGLWYWGDMNKGAVAPTFTPRADETAGWKTYTNAEYGFEFKYPRDWRIVDGAGTGGHEYQPDYTVGLAPKEITQDYTNAVDTYKEPLASVVKNSPFYNGAYKRTYKTEFSMMDGIQCKKIVIETPLYSGGTTTGTHYLCEKNGMTFDLGLEDQILSTFKFIEPVVCIQVITPARNLQTGEIRDFPTPCDVPSGWVKI